VKIRKITKSEPFIDIATWQSIYKQPASFFAKYDVVVGDECHLTTAKSLSSIMEKCVNAYIRAGVSGTLDGSVVNEMVLKGHYGPIYRVATTAQLMDKGILTNLAIKAIVLKHPEEACKTFGKVQYVDEMDYLVRNQRRNQFISKLAGQTEGNTLVLFQFVQKHGKPLEQMLKSMNPHREVYFVHGGVSGDDREQIRQLVERKGRYIDLFFGDKKIRVSRTSSVPLANGEFKKASNITCDDDVSDEWIKSYVNTGSS
jgi:superfamily II DNA or RNA helicase